MKIKYRKVWRNRIKQIRIHPFQYLIPESLEDIRNLIRKAEQEGFQVRAVGSGHSFSDCAVTEGYLVDMSALTQIDVKPPAFLKPAVIAEKAAENRHLVQVQAGVVIQRLNKHLDREGLGLINMGAIDEQTISGAVSTGTHGSGNGLPALSGMVRSIVLVASGGRAFRIEPTAGITDPALHREPDIELIQDDTVFNSCLVSLGCMGIIYSFVIEVKTAYRLYEVKELKPWAETRELIRSRALFADFPVEVSRGKSEKRPVYSAFVILSPHRYKGGISCVVSRQMLLQEGDCRHRNFNQRTRNLVGQLAGYLPMSYWASLLIANYIPRLVPWMLYSSMKSLKDRVFVNTSYKVLYQGVEYLQKKALGAEFAYPVYEDGLKALEEVFEQVEKIGKTFRIFLSSAMTIRFVQASPAYITPEYNRDVLYATNPVLGKQQAHALILNELQKVHLRNGGIPHWGKRIDVAEGQQALLDKWYPKLAVWQSVMRRFNPNGTFNNRYSDRMLLTRSPEVEHTLTDTTS